MRFSTCRPYHSRTVERSVLRLPDGKSVFKVYFISLVGRDEPERYEWARHAGTPPQFMSRAQTAPWEGVGFLTVFTHITKVFRFAPAMETVLHVRAFHTADLTPLDLSRDDGYLEFACYAEAAIAADEYRSWAQAGTVDDYLRTWSTFDEGPVVSRTKLADYWKRC